MAGEKMDRRVRYTKMMLKQSLLTLMKKRSINQITVKEICQLADINRGTFYTHYSDPYDLLHQIEGEFLEQVQSTLTSTAADPANATDRLNEIFQCIWENRELCKVIFSPYGDGDFLKKIMYIAQERCQVEWLPFISPEAAKQMDYLFSFTANGSVGLVQEWVQKGMKEPPQEMAALISKLTYNGLEAFFPR